MPPRMPMQTIDEAIRSSTEFVCERWGQGEGAIEFYAPVTRLDGMTWVHPTWAREAAPEAIRRRATRIWLVSGSLWNPRGYALVYGRGLERPAEGEPAAA